MNIDYLITLSILSPTGSDSPPSRGCGLPMTTSERKLRSTDRGGSRDGGLINRQVKNCIHKRTNSKIKNTSHPDGWLAFLAKMDAFDTRNNFLPFLLFLQFPSLIFYHISAIFSKHEKNLPWRVFYIQIIRFAAFNISWLLSFLHLFADIRN